MRRLAVIWVVLLCAACLIAGALVGFESRGPSSSGGGVASGSSVLSITAAGTLGDAFPAVGRVVVNNSPGVQDPSSSQEYQGSVAALRVLLPPVSSGFDVAASADFRLIPQLLEPSGLAHWEVVFASDPEVLTYDPTSSALAGINATNWPTLLEAPGVLLGVANASADPNGYNEIFVLELEDRLLAGSVPSLYAHFYGGVAGSLAVPNPATTRVESETAVASLLASHTVQAFITYRSYAITHGLSYVQFDPRVAMGGINASDIDFDALATTSVLTTSGGLQPVTGAPVAFGLTVPSNAPNATLGDLFATTLLSPVGSSILLSEGFSPISPAYAQGTNVAAALAPQTVPLPSSLNALV